MYLRHFAFSRLPFRRHHRSRPAVASAARQEAEARLQLLRELRGIGLLTGEPGGGKDHRLPPGGDRRPQSRRRVLYVSLRIREIPALLRTMRAPLGN